MRRRISTIVEVQNKKKEFVFSPAHFLRFVAAMKFKRMSRLDLGSPICVVVAAALMHFQRDFRAAATNVNATTSNLSFTHVTIQPTKVTDRPTHTNHQQAGKKTSAHRQTSRRTEG